MIGYRFGWLASDWLLGSLDGSCMFIWMASHWFGWKVGCVFDWIVDWLVDQLLVWLVGWTFGYWFGQLARYLAD